MVRSSPGVKPSTERGLGIEAAFVPGAVSTACPIAGESEAASNRMNDMQRLDRNE
jgi:hypothetical protein